MWPVALRVCILLLLRLLRDGIAAPGRLLWRLHARLGITCEVKAFCLIMYQPEPHVRCPRSKKPALLCAFRRTAGKILFLSASLLHAAFLSTVFMEPHSHRGSAQSTEHGHREQMLVLACSADNAPLRARLLGLGSLPEPPFATTPSFSRKELMRLPCSCHTRSTSRMFWGSVWNSARTASSLAPCVCQLVSTCSQDIWHHATSTRS